ncbi:hypothetical protein [Mycobacterium lacus]|uniref:Proline rich protein n=1 Tax=Mycobacterium lacus TaxID=169765 RepID=A0A7I7NQH5_9MYCO|nr:hypothetical protein [Mycobacterium lacus]MCV7122623.1 hypothetical protein [Mycobacterium lacus]BBX97767.1 hypothetical protein MLAC_30610 [Mycobacterium lacus]
MKFSLNVLDKRADGRARRWPSHLFGGRVRTSTLALVVAFLAVWWVYDTYRPQPPAKPPPAQVVPPGFVPDPNYTWVPRTRVNQPQPTVKAPRTPTTTETTAPSPTTTTTTGPPPCLLPPPFCPATTSPTTSPAQLPQPGPGPAPASAPPAG